MMIHSSVYAVGHDEQLSCTVLEMPFKGNLSALFILPDEGEMKNVEEALGMNTFAKWKKLLNRR